MDLTSKIAAMQNFREYEELNWTGSFEDYLKIVRENPKVTRTAFQRVYDMILSYGQEEYIDNKKKLIRYNFFRDEQHGGRDAVPLLRVEERRHALLLEDARRARSGCEQVSTHQVRRRRLGALATAFARSDPKRPGATRSEVTAAFPATAAA